MATLGATYLYGFAGGEVNKEDVLDMIINIDPFDTPLLNMAPKVPANHTTVEWLQDNLDATATASRPEGQAFSADTLTAPTRVTNNTQIMGNHVTVSETQQVVSPYGFTDTFLYNIMKGTRAVMRNIEVSLFRASGGSARGSASAGSAGVTRYMKTLHDFLTTNKYVPGLNTLGGAITAVTALVSAATIPEAQFNAALQLIYENGGNPTWTFASPAAKRTISGYEGTTSNAATAVTVNVNASEQQITRAVNTLLTDFGLMNIMLDRWVPQSSNTTTTNTSMIGTLFILELPRVQVAFLRPVRFKRLAEDGDRVRGMVIGEYTLKVLAESGSGMFVGVNNVV